jgi:hypothetical protein
MPSRCGAMATVEIGEFVGLNFLTTMILLLNFSCQPFGCFD